MQPAGYYQQRRWGNRKEKKTKLHELQAKRS